MSTASMHRPTVVAVRRTGMVTDPVGCGPGDHLLWLYDDEPSWQSSAVAFLAEGADRGEQMLYVAGKPTEALCDDLSALAGRDALLGSGQLLTQPWPHNLSTADVHVPNSVAGGVARRMAAALQAGYRGLRVAADATTLITDPAAAPPAAGGELALDVLAASSPLTVMCGYHRSRVPFDSVLRCAHPISSTGGEGACGLYYQQGGWQLTGEVNYAASDGLRAALAAAAAEVVDADVHIDCHSLDFISVTAIEVLITQARALLPPRRLIIHHPPSCLARALAVAWDKPTGLEVAPG